MIPDISYALSWLRCHSKILQGIHRGIERETLRIDKHGNLSQVTHPKKFGSSLTHKFITTDFSEALLEFITPVDNNLNRTLTMLRDIHRYVARNLENEQMWPFSMPCCTKNQSISLAQFGSSNIGRMKTIYRTGLKHRYTDLMQIISGVHYNFSVPVLFWKEYSSLLKREFKQSLISSGYFQLMRNYYKFGWVIPYLFGSSPCVSQSFINNRHTTVKFNKSPMGFLYLPYATSLRLSDLGYVTQVQNQLNFNYSNLEDYIFSLKKAISTPSIKYQNIGLKKHGKYIQLNTNILQSENEFYAPIRPKSTIKNNELMLHSLLRNGIEYVEIRSLDINPFSPIGISEEQIKFLDIFLIWCLLAQSQTISAQEQLYIRSNWNIVVTQGRKPGIRLYTDKNHKKQSLLNLIQHLFNNLSIIAEILDNNSPEDNYQNICNKLALSINDPELTFSARLLEKTKKYGIHELGIHLSRKYLKKLRKEKLEIIREKHFSQEKIRSLKHQVFLETTDSKSFESFLEERNKILNNIF